MDVDGNGKVDALTDAILISRYISGVFPGDKLTAGAVAPDATRKTPEAVSAFMNQYMLSPSF